MTGSVSQQGSQAAPAGNVLARMVGVVVSPRATFERIVAAPGWIVPLALVTLIVVGVTYAFLSTEVGQTALLDQQVRQMENFGLQISEQQYRQMEQGLPMTAVITAISQIVMIPVVTLVIAGILFGVFNALLGGSASFKQVAAIVTYSGAITIIQQLFVAPLNYARGSMSSATNLAVFTPFLDEANIVARFLGTIDLFIVWWLVVLAIGLGVLFRRRTAPIFSAFMGLYFVIALVIALAMRAASGGA